MFDKIYKSVSEIPRECLSQHGIVYAALIDGKVKIGSSIKPKVRLQSMQTMGGRKIEAVYISPQGMNYREIEKALHDLLADYREFGEWFRCRFDLAVYAIRKEKFQEGEAAIEAERQELFYWANNICRDIPYPA